MTPTSASLAVLTLTNRLVDCGVKPLAAGEYWELDRRVGGIANLGSLEDAELDVALDGSRIPAERVRALLDSGAALGFELERLESIGIEVVTAVDDAYPARMRDRLGDAAPPLLFTTGPTGLLGVDEVGVVGSRDVSTEGAEVARAAARVAVRDGVPVVSGGARGVDQLAMQSAFEAGGTVVAVLADSLERSLRQPDAREAVLDGRVCLLTPYKPSMGFTAANAMGRNKIIYALSGVCLVVASDLERGGTWAGATEALVKQICTVAVWRGPGEGPGNEALVARGAIAVSDVAEISAMRGEPMRMPNDRGRGSDLATEQLTLGIAP